jgi:hypothetical protein
MGVGQYPKGQSPSDSAGLMIIRAWTDGDGAVRARLVLTTDVSQSVQIVRSLDSAEEVEVAVREWLADLARTATRSRP